MWTIVGIGMFFIAIKELWGVFFNLLGFFALLAGVGFYQDGQIGHAVAYISLATFIFFVNS